MGFVDWLNRVFRGGGADEDAAEREEYGASTDPGLEDLREHEAPSLLGGVEPSKEDFEEPR